MENLKTQLRTAVSYNNVTSTLFFQMKNGEIKKANMDNQQALPDMTQNYISSIKTVILDDSELSQIVNLSAADARKNVLYKYDLQDFPVKLQLVRDIDNWDSPLPFTYGDDSLSDIYAYIIIIHCEDKDILLYRKLHPINIYKRGMIMWWKTNRFDFVNEDLLKLDSTFDFIVFNNNWYIFNLKALEKDMGYDGVIKSETKMIVEKIKAVELIDDYKKFDIFCENITFAKKILRASSSPVLDLQAELIIQFSKDYPSLQGKFTYSNDGKIIISSKEKMTLFMKLLNDDLLTSELTRKHYESLAKDEAA